MPSSGVNLPRRPIPAVFQAIQPANRTTTNANRGAKSAPCVQPVRNHTNHSTK
jgi:hypothetical protein